MNDGRTQYDVEENYEWVCHLMQNGDKFIELKEHNYGQVLININNVLSVKESRDYEK